MQTSCSPKVPLVQLEENGQAPILRYNIPQKTCYNGNGYFPVEVPEDYFNDSFKINPVGDPWEIAGKLELDAIKEKLKVELVNPENAVLLRNSVLLKRKKDSIKLLASPEILQDSESPATGLLGKKLDAAGAPPATASIGENKSVNSNRLIRRMNHISAIKTLEPQWIEVAGYSLDYLAIQISNGRIPEFFVEFGGRLSVRFLTKPKPQPRITIIENYKTCSFLGDYGAGKTLRTFSLLPGEQTEIAIKTYNDQTSSFSRSSQATSSESLSSYYSEDETSTRTRSENILDSFSQYSADQLQSQIEQAQGDYSSSEVGSQVVSETQAGQGHQGGFNLLGLAHFTRGKGSTTATTNATATNSIRGEYMDTLESSLESSVSESSQYREVDVNTSSGNILNQSSGGSQVASQSLSLAEEESLLIKAGEETATIRRIQNINWSRVLNFVFRQLLQEYIVLTYLHDASIVFSTGFPEHLISVKPSSMDLLLDQVIPDPIQREEIKTKILVHFCNVMDYEGNIHPFLEKITETYQNCHTQSPLDPVDYYRKVKGLSQTYDARGMKFTIPGIILSAGHHVLRTDSVIVDAVLGQGDALDCFNHRMQEEAAHNSELVNQRYKTETEIVKRKADIALSAIEKIQDPEKRAEAYNLIFGECCEENLGTGNLGA